MDNDYPVSALVERLYVGVFIAHYIRRELRCRYLDRVAVVTRHRHRVSWIILIASVMDREFSIKASPTLVRRSPVR